MRIFTSKNIYLFLIAAIVSLTATAQNLRVNHYTLNGAEYTDSLWFTHQEFINHAYGNLNLQEVGSGFLMDRAETPLTPAHYNGVISVDLKGIHSFSNAFNIYNSFYEAVIDTNALEPYARPDSLSAKVIQLARQGYVPIAFLDHAYHRIRPDALSLGLFTTNIDSTILYDNPIRTLSPYEEHRLFVASAYSINEIYRSHGDVKFYFAPDKLYLTDTIGEVQINFDDGMGLRTITPGTELNITYTTSGQKFIRITKNGLECTFHFNFEKDSLFYNTTETEYSAPPENMQRTLGPITGATVFTTLGCDGVLDKPILIVEGLEIEEVQRPDDIIERLNDDDASNSLVTRLLELNYDILVVKFRKNNASIFDNAKALENVINEVNQAKVGTGKLHIIGLSMGGLVAKYCLKDMEDRNIDHQVENYFSYDSPHQGAYIPLGMQFLFNTVNKHVKQIREDPTFKFVYNALESVAAKQLLQLHYRMFDFYESAATVATRTDFASAYLSKGYPANCHNYGIANGRGDGTGLGYAGGTNMLDFTGKVKLGSTALLRQNQQFWALNNTISDLMYFRSRGIFTWDKDIDKSKSTVRASFSTLLETVPGSTNGAHKEYETSLYKGWPTSDATLNPSVPEKFSFVSTVSALDLNNQNYGSLSSYIPQNPYYNIHSNRSTVLAHHTPFEDVIYAIGDSDGHLTINSGISDFILEKIHGSIPVFNCNSGCIIEPTLSTTGFCMYREQEITTNIPSGVAINWTVPSNVTLLSGQGTNRIKILTATHTNITITLTITKPGCTSSVYNYPLTNNTTRITDSEGSFITGSASLCSTKTYEFNGAVDNIIWSVSSNLRIVSISPSGNSAVIEPSNYYPNMGAFGIIEIKNGCTVITRTVGMQPTGNGILYTILGPQVLDYGGEICKNATTELQLSWNDRPPGEYYFQWGSYDGFTFTYLNPYGTHIYIHPPANYNGTGPVHIAAEMGNEECGSISFVEYYFDVKDCLNPWSNYITIFPNPTNEVLNINFNKYYVESKNSSAAKISEEQLEVKLYDNKGQQVRNGILSDHLQFETKSLLNGTYFLHIKKGKELIKRQIIIEH